MKPATAKKLVENFLHERKIEVQKVTAKTVSFEDLARDSKTFVSVHNAPNGMYWEDLQRLAIENGFKVNSR